MLNLCLHALFHTDDEQMNPMLNMTRRGRSEQSRDADTLHYAQFNSALIKPVRLQKGQTNEATGFIYFRKLNCKMPTALDSVIFLSSDMKWTNSRCCSLFPFLCLSTVWVSPISHLSVHFTMETNEEAQKSWKRNVTRSVGSLLQQWHSLGHMMTTVVQWCVHVLTAHAWDPILWSFFFFSLYFEVFPPLPWNRPASNWATEKKKDGYPVEK